MRFGIPLGVSLFLGLSAADFGSERRGTSSYIPADTLDSGGGLSTTKSFANQGSMGGVVGMSASAQALAQHGYVAQVDLHLRLPPKPVLRVRATCLSIAMQPFAGLIQGDSNTNYVTTFDGSPARPNTEAFSAEVRPRPGQPSTYEADFVTYNSAGVLWQYGSFTTFMPPTDSDLNTIPDLIQLDQPGDTVVTGQSVPDWPAIPTATLQGSMSRSAGSPKGAFDLTLQNTLGTVAYRGTFNLVWFELEAAYSRGDANRLEFTRVLRGSDSFTNVLGGACSFGLPDADHLEIPAFTLTNVDGTAYSVLPTTLVRTGHRYVGPMQLADGNLLTAWPDFTQWVLEVTDDTDANQNGVPDLSDLEQAPLDTDGDGMPDAYELAHGLDPHNGADALSDRDGDGLSNLMEQWAGTDPGNPKSVLELKIEIRDGYCYLNLDSVSNRVYRFEVCRDLANRIWEPLYTGVPGTGQPTSLADTNAPSAQRYYRLLVSPAGP